MKTAVSIPDAVFQAAEDAAKRLSVSRSELYTKALETFLHNKSAREITQQLNAVYAHEPSAVDSRLYAAAARSIGSEAW